MKLNDLKWRAAHRLKAFLRGRLTPAARATLRQHLLSRWRSKYHLKLEHCTVDPTRPTPLVSVIIPCYNYGRFVSNAVNSVLVQTLQDFEIIVVDDGSTDPETVEVLDRLDFPKVTLLRQTNAGLPSARNAGIKQARGHYICCLDADDTLEPTYLEKCVGALESNPGIGLAYSWLELYGDESGYWETADLDPERLLLTNHIIVSAVFRRADWQRSGGYSPEMRGGYEDWEFWLRLASLGIRGKAIPEPLFRHYRHGRTMTHEANDMAAELMRRMRRRNAMFYGSYRLRRRIRRGYRDIQLDNPFAHLARPEQFRRGGRPLSTLVVLPWLDSGGAETLMLDLLVGLADERSLYVVTTLPHPHPLHANFATVAEAIYHLPNFLSERDWLPFLDNLIATRAIDTVLVSGSEYGYSVLAKLRSRHPALRVVDLLHNDSPLGHLHNALRADSEIDVHVGVNPHVAEALVQRGVASEKCITIRNGIDVSGNFAPLQGARASERAALGLSDDIFICLFVGRFSSEKRPDSFAALAGNFIAEPGVRFVMVGHGPMESMLKARNRDILFLEPRPRTQMPYLYAIADVLVMTSAIEGLPMVMLEALAMGVPVLATRVGDIGSVIRDGVNGFTVDPERPEALAPLIRDLAADRERLQQMSLAARASLVEQGLTLDAMLTGYRELFARFGAALSEASVA